MALHVKLDFTTPFSVGDTVWTAYPADQPKHVSGPVSYDCLEGKVSMVKFVLAGNNPCTVSEPLTEKELTVETVVYTVMPLNHRELSPFTVECATGADSHPKLFARQEDLRTYQA